MFALSALIECQFQVCSSGLFIIRGIVNTIELSNDLK